MGILEKEREARELLRSIAKISGQYVKTMERWLEVGDFTKAEAEYEALKAFCKRKFRYFDVQKEKLKTMRETHGQG